MIYFYFLLVGFVAYWWDSDYNVEYLKRGLKKYKGSVILAMILTFIMYELWIIYFLSWKITGQKDYKIKNNMRK